MKEGYLRKWVNIVYGWRPRYFILHDGLLTFCDKKGGIQKGTISLKIASISTIPEDALRIVIHTGYHEIHVRAENSHEMKKWYQALAEEQEKIIQKEHLKDYPEKEIEEAEKSLSPEKKAITKQSNLDSLKEKLAELWCCQAEFDEAISLIAPKVKSNPDLYNQMTKLEQLGRDIKYRVTECVTKIEDEKIKVISIAQRFDPTYGPEDSALNKRLNFDPEYGIGSMGRPTVFNEDLIDVDGTVFKSFDSLEESSSSEEEEKAPDYEELYKPPSRRPTLTQNKDVVPLNIDIGSIANNPESINPIVKAILTKNPVFIETQPIPKDNRRDKMPYWLDPNQKMNIWAIAKDLIGKDLTKFAVPVWLNEPLSMLQKLCEQLEYSKLLDIASQKDDSCLRMAYVMGFAFSYYAGTIGRHKKPFNPILGETFEYCPVDGSFKFISEQVSHHPPISAGYAESANFQWWGDTQIKTSFRGTSLEAKSLGSVHAIIKKYGDHIVYRRPVTAVNNIVIGAMYIENYGDMPFENNKTGDTGLLTMKKRGWGDRGAYESEGWIKDKNGTLKYTLHGKWNSYLSAVDATTKQEIRIWDRNPIPDNYEQQYNFSNYTKQLNYLHEDLIPKLIATDCRFRPDQRALEYGFLDLARDEKLRLEEKQRTRRKEMHAKNEPHKPRFFTEVVDSVTDEKSYAYAGGYFEAREKCNFGQTLDLF